MNTRKWLKLKCNDPFVVKTDGKVEWSHSRNSTVMNYAVTYDAVEKVDEDLAGKYLQQGIQYTDAAT